MLHSQIVSSIAEEYDLDPRLVFAIIMVESSNRSNVARYEAHFRWTTNEAEHAKRIGITEASEHQLQKFSWGLMQTMGGSVRDLGYMGFLPELCVPQVGIRWGCMYLRKLMDRYGNDVERAVAAYNAGSSRKRDDGKYVNQEYVDKVFTHFDKMKGLKL